MGPSATERMRSSGRSSHLSISDDSHNAATHKSEDSTIKTSISGGSGHTSNYLQSTDIWIKSTRFSTESSREMYVEDRMESATAIEPSKRRTNDISDITLGKLRMSNLPVHGRDNELRVLNGAFDQVNGKEVERSLVMIAGPSGTGKSKLASTLKQKTVRNGGVYVSGKHEFKRGQAPHSALKSACGEICDHITNLCENDPRKSAKIVSSITMTLGSELHLISSFVAKLFAERDDGDKKKIFKQNSSADMTNVKQVGTADTSTSNFKFHYAFLRFMRIVCEHFSPMVLFLDDLQWADKASLDLIDMILTDSQNSKVLIIGAFRSNEVESTSPFYQTLAHLDEKAEHGDISMTKIEIGNLDLEGTQMVVKDVLSYDDEERTLALAALAMKKTNGNVFFLLCFLQVLQERRLIEFNLATLEWTWSQEEIDITASASDNVLDLLLSRMKCLEERLLQVLTIAGMLGSTFDQKTIQLIHQNIYGRLKQKGVDDLLEDLQDEGFLVKHEDFDSTFYKWQHDSIHEAALSLVPEEDRLSFGRQIGEIMIDEMNDDELEEGPIFVAVNLLNLSISIPEPSQRVRLAVLNHRVCVKAMEVAAYTSCAEYATKGLQFLPYTSWDDHPRLKLSLLTLAARAEACLGNEEKVESLCQQVLSRKEIPFEDKIEIFIAWIDALKTGTTAWKKARDILLDALADLSITFPTGLVAIGIRFLRGLLKAKRTIKKLDVRNISRCEDKRAIAIMGLLDRLSFCFLAQADSRMPLVAFQTWEMTRKFGYCDFSPSSLVWVGILMTIALKDYRQGAYCGELAISLLNHGQLEDGVKTEVLCHVMLFPWVKPSQAMLKPLLALYDRGLKVGDTEQATYAITEWLNQMYRLGKSLETIMADAVKYAQQAEDIGKPNGAMLAKMIGQSCSNLMNLDNPDEPSRMTGTILTEENAKLYAQLNEGMYDGIVEIKRAVIHAYAGQHVEVAKKALRFGLGYYDKFSYGNAANAWIEYLVGVSSFSAFQKTRKRKYLRAARYYLKRTTALQEGGYPNVQHYASFLQAESMALRRGKSQHASKLFEQTVLIAVRNGYIHDAALASERFGDFQRVVMKDSYEAQYRYQEAIKYYDEWGCHTRARELGRQHSAWLSSEFLTKEGAI